MKASLFASAVCCGGLLLLAACGPASPTATAILPTATPAPPTATSLAPTATPAPAPVPTTQPLDGGGLIAFYSQRDGNAEIYTMRADGSDPLRLTSNEYDDDSPDWAPDGSRIAFLSDREDPKPTACFPQCFYQLYVINADGSDEHRLVETEFTVLHPDWHPAGDRLSFDSASNLQGDIYVVQADGTGLQLLIADGFWADWSPDGTQIAFASNRDGNVEIYVADADGSNQRRLTENTTLDYFPAWSPDGRRIAFAVMEEKEIFVMNADGSAVRQLTDQGRCEDPAWSPDGSQIAFQSSSDGDFEIYTLNVEAALRGEGSARQLTDNRVGEFWPSWLPAADAASTWFKTYGGRQDDVAWGLLPAGDGGYYVVGTTDLQFEPQMRANVHLIRTDAAGDVLWEKTYERDGYAEGAAISWTDDGNLLISGPAIFSTTNGTDIYLLEVDPSGNELGFRTFDGPLDEMGTAWPLEDGGFLLAGNRIDPNDIVADPGAAGYGGMAGRSSVYLARFDADGTARWSRTYGGQNNVLAFGGRQTPDGGLLILATIMYYPENDDDIYLLKVDADGNEVWSRTWEEGMAGAAGLVLTGDGNYLLAGSYSPPEVMDREKRDLLFIKIDPQGNEIWRRVWGDPEAGDDAALLAATADGGCIAAGDMGGDLASWNQDIALLKLDAQGQQVWRQVIATRSHQMYGQIMQHPDGGYLLVGSLVRNGQFDIFMLKTDAQGHVAQP